MEDFASRIDAYFRSIAKSTTLKSAIECTSAFLERPVAVIDSAMNHIGHAPDRFTGDSDWDSLLRLGHVHPTYAVITRHDNALAMPPDMLHRCVYAPANEAEMEKYRCRLSSGSLHLGGMMVLADGRPFSQADTLLLQIACQTLSRTLHDLQEPLYSRQKARQRILCELLTRDPHHVLEEIRQHHPDLYALEGQPMVIGFNDPHPGDYDLSPFWQQLFSSNLPNVHVIQYQGSLIFLFSIGKRPYDEFLSSVAQYVSHIHFQIGLSDPFTSLLDLKVHYELAHQAYLFGRQQNPDAPIFTVDAHRLALMLQHMLQSDGLLPLCHPAALRLQAYDKSHGTQYCRILRVYLTQFHNYSLAAKALFMHRNTLTYHLARIEKLLSLSLEDADVCQTLLLSLLLLDNQSIRQDTGLSGEPQSPSES